MYISKKPPRIFYGWWVVGASFLINLYTAGAIYYGFTAIIEPIANDLGWSYSQISLGFSLRGLEIGLLAPFTGMLADRWGPRRLVVGGAVVTALGLTLLSRASSLAMFYGAFLTIALGISALSTTVLMTALGNWFDSKIGLVSGIAASGFGFGGLLIPVVVKLVDSWGWQTATAALGLGLLVVAAPLGSLFRHKPEHYGYLPDGEIKSPAATGANPDVPRTSLKDVGIRRVLRSSAFWYMTIAFGCQLLVAQAVFTHVMPYLSSVEVSRSISSSVATFVPVVSVVGRLGIGWFGDKLDSRLVTVATFVMVCSGLIIFEYVTSAEMWLLVPFVILFGIGHGGIVSLRPSLIRKFFGRASFGTIFGSVIGLIVLLSMAGPPLAGWVFDHWGSYQNTWLAFAGLVGVAALSIVTVSRVGANRGSAEDADSA